MSDRLCVVTGTTSGIGLALARILVERGWSVLGAARRPAPLSHPAYRYAQVDLSDASALEAFCAGPLAEALGAPGLRRLGLVNDAGALGPVLPASRLGAGPVTRVLAVNVVAPLRLMGALLAGAAGRPLRVVNVSSGAATRAYAGWAAYCASKAALRMAGQVVAAEAAPRPPGSAGPPALAVVSYEPGVVDTAMQAELRGAARQDFPLLDRFLDLHARGALVSPERPAREIADLLERDDLAPFEERRLGA